MNKLKCTEFLIALGTMLWSPREASSETRFYITMTYRHQELENYDLDYENQYFWLIVCNRNNEASGSL